MSDENSNEVQQIHAAVQVLILCNFIDKKET